MSDALRIPLTDNKSQYVTLGDEDSPPPGAQYALHNGHFPSYSDDSEAEDVVVHQEHRTWWQRFRHRGSPPAPVERPQSGYLTLIPLSDSRLKPRHTKLIVGTLLFLTLLSVCAVYFTVARGVTVGTIEVVNSTISFNTSQGTYQIVLWSQLPIYNPNYASVRVSGRINVSFYDQQAGYTILEPVDIPARAQPEVITVDINSSSVPHKYLFTIYTQCFTFPEKLIFFLTAELKSQYLGTTYALPRIDNYAIVGCGGSADADTENRRSKAVDLLFEQLGMPRVLNSSASGSSRTTDKMINAGGDLSSALAAQSSSMPVVGDTG